MGEESPLCQGGVAEKVDDQSMQRQGDGSKMDDPQPNTQGGMADKMDDQQLQPVPPPLDTTSHPQQMGGGAEAVQPVYHSPSLEDEEMLQTSIEESLMPSPATLHMAVSGTSLVKTEWYPENSELVVPTTK